jgi:hypothetical protein
MMEKRNERKDTIGLNEELFPFALTCDVARPWYIRDECNKYNANYCFVAIKLI